MKSILILFAVFVAITSCQKVIDVDLNEANAKVVIEANYSAEDSTVKVRLSKTTSYFEPSSASTLNGASVSIIDENGVSSLLSNTGNGEYALTNYTPLFNTNYTMIVNYEGVTYTASSLLPDPVPQSPITYEYTPGFFGSGEGYLSTINYSDPTTVENFYLMVFTRNGFEKNKVTDFILGDDRLSDGNPVSRPLFIDSLFNLGDSIEIELRSISENIYYYYDELQSIAGAGQASAAPGNPLDIWDNDALGYFSAYSNSRESVVIL